MGWIIWFLLMAIGVLNIVLVHPIPGIIYILFSLIYLPPFNWFLQRKYHFAIPVLLKVVLIILVLWFTLGVGDLMEVFETWALK